MSFSDFEHWQPHNFDSKTLYWVRLVSALIAAAALGFAIHVLYGRGWAQAYVNAAAAAGRLNGTVHEPYPNYVVIVAFATELLVVAGKIIAYVLLRNRLPGKSRLAKGFWFGVLLMGMSDALIRGPFMNYIVGNPIDVVLVQGLEGWLIDLTAGIAIAVLVP